MGRCALQLAAEQWVSSPGSLPSSAAPMPPQPASPAPLPPSAPLPRKLSRSLTWGASSAAAWASPNTERPQPPHQESDGRRANGSDASAQITPTPPLFGQQTSGGLPRSQSHIPGQSYSEVSTAVAAAAAAAAEWSSAATGRKKAAQQRVAEACAKKSTPGPVSQEGNLLRFVQPTERTLSLLCTIILQESGGSECG